ncbi:beta-1 adrenergic receptor-like [Patiria miniata]|uniref:G-protein coupled receptors family 1 profile domain-containing protein n=1 Tax=Patiria miniata TaxID=46514 RepID=A0A913Z3H5_PATMI|nr:beta-1 adrenergic receptor-like [Patiria miniata]
MADVLLILRVCRTIIGVVGVLGNCLVIVVICRVHFMHTLTNAFICHQAVIDLLGSLLLVLQNNIPVPVPLPETTAGEVLCRMWIGDALLWVMFVTSTFSLLNLTLERYVAIVYPFKFQALFSKKSGAVMMIVVWLIGLLLKSYSFLIYSNIDGKCKFLQLEASKVIGPLLICLQYFAPACIMIFCYTHITITLKRSAKQIGPLTATISNHNGVEGSHNLAASAMGQSRLGNEQQDSLLRARRNTFKTLFIVFVTFLICWSPSQFTFFLFNVGLIKIDYDGPLMVTSTILVASNCCINPIIYSFKYRQFRRALRKLIGRPEATEDAMITMSTAQTAISAVRVEKPS